MTSKCQQLHAANRNSTQLVQVDPAAIGLAVIIGADLDSDSGITNVGSRIARVERHGKIISKVKTIVNLVLNDGVADALLNIKMCIQAIISRRSLAGKPLDLQMADGNPPNTSRVLVLLIPADADLVINPTTIFDRHSLGACRGWIRNRTDYTIDISLSRQGKSDRQRSSSCHSDRSLDHLDDHVLGVPPLLDCNCPTDFSGDPRPVCK